MHLVQHVMLNHHSCDAKKAIKIYMIQNDK